MRPHCWHNDGPTLSHFTGGSEPVRCCWCSATGVRSFRVESAPIAGHGAHVTAECIVTEPPSVHTGWRDCTPRPLTIHHPPAPPPGFNDSEGDETL